MQKEKKKISEMRTRNKILLSTALFIVAFIMVMIVIFILFQSVPDTLITCVLGGGGLVEIVTGVMSIMEIGKGNENGN